MADFNISIAKTLHWEGGYNPGVGEAETLFGVDRSQHPEWEGWPTVDSLKQQHSGHELTITLNSNTELLANAKSFYRANFWNYDDISDQAVADKLFDFGVNDGKHEAVKLLQMTLGISSDGVYGSQTLESINAADSADLLTRYRAAIVNHYEQIVAAHPEKSRWLHSWLERANS